MDHVHPSFTGNAEIGIEISRWMTDASLLEPENETGKIRLTRNAAIGCSRWMISISSRGGSVLRFFDAGQRDAQRSC